ncbi:carboxypeptidase-like regulatory domain-containing protein [Steroidobacter cummioxidans]|uniref:carboxypeptidase-like regulatory domain-containing protein n=1 Tax=Steroidobacter cummioxidans TaxID=1803913 RepID=UPI00137B7FED|nr:carboxypeptidase-like regulatory domain-containing protein [Steroidobacter cummioxidans]
MSSFRSGHSPGKAVLSTLLLSVLAACGGGGGNGGGGTDGPSGNNPPPGPAMSRLTLTGTVTDAPIRGALVTATVGSQTFTATADANGNYRIELSVEESATSGFLSP